MTLSFDQKRRERFQVIGGDVITASDHRSAFRHDRDRIQYSSAFRRLSGITQVVSPSGSHPTHNRLTHSLEVAQIGRSLAERLLTNHRPEDFEHLGGLDADVVEAACLAHDLGHPPFGHVAETELNRLITSRQVGGDQDSLDGFEGNAQTFRILTRLAVRYTQVRGLNLTRATLAATSKYPWHRGTSGKTARKWGAYGSEAELLEWSREHLPAERRNTQTLEAQLMDWADDVAYAVHDLEDFYRAGVIPLERLVTDPNERARFLEGYTARNGAEGSTIADLELAFEDLVIGFPNEPFHGSYLDKATLRSLTSTLVGRYVSAVVFDTEQGEVIINPDRAMEVKLLKDITWHYVIESRALISQRYGHASLIRGLFETLLTAATSNEYSQRERDSRILPEYFREDIAEAEFDRQVVIRVVADAISSMSEAQAVGLYNRLLGYSLGSALDPILN